VAIKLAPKVRVNARQMVLMSNLFAGITLFIVKQYTLDDLAVSIDIDQKFDSGSPVATSGDPWFGSLLIFYNQAHRYGELTVYPPLVGLPARHRRVNLWRACPPQIKALYKDVDRIYIYTKIIS